jgi:hypothetical protein
MPLNQLMRSGETLADLRDEFRSRVERHESGCWLWKGQVTAYGTFRGQPAHRVSWELHQGEIARGLVVLHGCNRKGCVNPEHLRPGTHRENMADVKRARSKGEVAPRKASEMISSDPNAPRTVRLSVNVNEYEYALLTVWSRMLGIGKDQGRASMSGAMVDAAVAEAQRWSQTVPPHWLPSWARESLGVVESEPA